MLKGKKIALYVTGGIAIYKVCDLVRKLIKSGAEVKVAMTASATKFVTPLTFQVLSKNDVYLDTFDEKVSQEVAHIHLADWSDMAVIAPATANSIAKLANGIADDFVSTALLATTAPVYVVPAMNQHMLENPATVRNLKTITADGRYIIEPATGFLAEGYEGRGRMPEPADILNEIELSLLKQRKNLPLSGKKIVVTAGGTKERIDPVRFITNDSSGKMGYSLAIAARDLGAEVHLISATTLIEAPKGVRVVNVQTAADMEKAVLAEFDAADIVIMAAAVSDFRVLHKAEQKIKKMESMTIELVKNPDILQGLGSKKSHQILVGFAAETEHVIKYGQDKVAKKNLDMLVANDVSKSNAGFNVDTNEGYFLYPDKEPKEMPNMKKSDLARHILREVIDLVANKHS